MYFRVKTEVMRLLILSVVGCLFSLPAGAQTTVPAWKVTFANQVLREVGAAYGFGLLELPKLVIFPVRGKTNNRIAKLELVLPSAKGPADNLDRSRLLMDEDLFDVCREADKNSGAALAFVLAHEMAHFYLRHATFRNFAGQKQATVAEAESSQQEGEADQKGLLFAYLAGYDPEPVLDALFDKLYGRYNLADRLPGYPAKTARQQATKRSAPEFRTYGYLFAVGHALYCRETFAEAARCFEYVYTRYPLKEAYNNFGVCRLQEVLRLKKKTPMSYFALPFEVDPRNRLLRLSERGNATDGAVTPLLDEASAAFRQAIAMDKIYQPAYLNGAIAGLLADNPYLALGVLDELMQQPGQVLPPNGYLIRGMAHCALGDWAQAESGISLAVARKAYQAAYNGRIFRAIRQGVVTTMRQPWQRLQQQSPKPAAMGCQSGGMLLQEVEAAPARFAFTTQLIEQTNPRPFIVVDYGQMGAETYFRVKLEPAANPARTAELIFVRKNSINKVGH